MRDHTYKDNTMAPQALSISGREHAPQSENTDCLCGMMSWCSGRRGKGLPQPLRRAALPAAVACVVLLLGSTLLLLAVPRSASADAELAWDGPGGPHPGVAADSSRLPNIVVLLSDDMAFLPHWEEQPAVRKTSHLTNQVSWPDSKHTVRRLPYSDRIRMEGVVFEKAYTASPRCMASRLATLTSRMPSRALATRTINRNATTGPNALEDTTWRALIDNYWVGMESLDEEENLPTALQDIGYRTGHVGKWHMEPKPKGHFRNYTASKEDVLAAGFDWVGALYEHNMPNSRSTGPAPEFSHNLEWLAEAGRNFISQAVEDEEPFFLYFATTTPHGPNNYLSMKRYSVRDTPEGRLAEDPDSDMPTRKEMLSRPGVTKKNAGYYWTDEAFGAIYRHLERLGVLDNTILVWAVDHGQNTKNTLFEGGVRTPMAIRYPPLIPAGTREPKLVSLVDLLPTFLHVASGAPQYPGFHMDGTSIFPLADEGHDVLYFESDINRALVTSRLKYIEFDSDGWNTGSTSSRLLPHMHGDYRDKRQLYDLVLDPSESTNLVTHPRYIAARHRFEAAMLCIDDKLALDVPDMRARRDSLQPCYALLGGL